MSTLSAFHRQVVLPGLISVCLSPTAWADGGVAIGLRLPAYQAECGACHIAYPPSLLGAKSWQQIMGGLSKHFGAEASLDASSTKSIAAWLGEHAGSGRSMGEVPPDNRITKSSWFTRQHEEVRGSVYKRAAVGSASNCAACHPRAADGIFDEENVRIPK